MQSNATLLGLPPAQLELELHRCRTRALNTRAILVARCGVGPCRLSVVFGTTAHICRAIGPRDEALHETWRLI